MAKFRKPYKGSARKHVTRVVFLYAVTVELPEMGSEVGSSIFGKRVARNFKTKNFALGLNSKTSPLNH
jgi:hypothetical protein